MQVESVNENTCIIYFGEVISEDTAHLIQKAVVRLRHALGVILLDIVPSYTSILVCFDLTKTDRFDIKAKINQALIESSDDISVNNDSLLIEIPVYYGSEVALDLNEVSQLTQRTPQQVIDIHSSKEYRVYAIGFSPGFSYLGSLDPKIIVPRKSKPRLKVPTGSVGLADNQTAIYPSSTPGGWQVIGRTPLTMLDWQSETLTKLNMGDRIRFKPINRDEYQDLGGTFDGI
ncbi:5-oxoprolinase subunit PxpB [Vibrio pelagius]|uniref:5-oxoprolinase subunit PxpB n=1 Tax=Vibrio pelagius TaxID=28169 RepID=UPI0021C3C684|nr:5-oxoprolinase subunit PxpB [Vibrio pelagius]